MSRRARPLLMLLPLAAAQTAAQAALPPAPISPPLHARVPAGQPEGSTLLAEDLRVAAMGYRLALAGRDLCPLQGPLTGLALRHLAEFAPADRPALVAGGMDRGPGVLAVVGGSPADRAGLRAGDVLLTLDGAPFPSPLAAAARPSDREWRPMVEAGERMLLDRLAAGAVTLTLLRDGRSHDVRLVPQTGCALRIRLARSPQKGAWTVRGHVIVTTAALGLAANDDELAFMIAHELAHVVLGHTRLLTDEGVPRRGLLRGMGRNGRLVRETEQEADQLGGRIMLAAGYDPGRGALVLPKLGTGPRLGLFETHESDGNRIRAMQALGKPERR